MRLLLCLPLLISISSACSSNSGGSTACTDVLVYGIVATVKDAKTGQLICNATVTANDGTTTSTLQPSGSGGSCTYVGAPEQPGQYTLSAAAPGYAQATAAATAAAGQCHVTTAAVTIPMTSQ
jgi:hypothetical protein